MDTNNCISNLLKLICLLQNNSIDSCSYDGCCKPYLGETSINIYNTRVISLYKKNGDIFSAPYNDEGTLTSNFFRVMSVDDTCCTLLILSADSSGTYQTTGQFITVNLNCICAVRCINDIYIENI